jgi:hypothetical protein|mmetsp:Transcript_109973/g.173259  ORF Transcript_109973/g.173259 Transcript_109973/m.173259 type:complete len:897 (+) Transcript_109973:132-2822(+)
MAKVRAAEIAYLQETNRQVLEQLENVEAEREKATKIIDKCKEAELILNAEKQQLRDKIDAHSKKVQDNKVTLVSKDEHIKIVSDQNTQMLKLCEDEETKRAQHENKIFDLEQKNHKLQRIADEFDIEKAKIEKKVAEAKTKSSEVIVNVKNQRSLNETLRANIQNTEAKTRVEIEAIGQSLQVVENKNLEYLSRINKQETREKQLQGETETLKEEVEKVRAEIDQLRKQLEGDSEGRVLFERQRSQIEMAIEALEVQADTLKKALNTAERANEQLQEENRTSAERCRETADKVYALMDSLRLNQVELKKQEAENTARDKKILALERQIQNLQAKIQMETDAKVLAEQETKEAQAEAGLLKKKNKKVEDRVTQSQLEQEKAEREIHDVNERVSALQTQNAFLASRIDGQEEEKNAMKAEIKKISDRISEVASENAKFREDIDVFEEQVATVTSEKANLNQQLDYIKREDVLDEAGRQRPILIQSTESDLLEKLQINEFLYESQQARNPVPPLIEKIAQLLAMLHEGQSRADTYLGDLSKSNSLVSALRQRNMALYSKTQMFESFKTRALIRYVMNLIEGDLVTDLHLDGLQFNNRELNEMVTMLQRYDATEKVYVVSFVDNGLDEDSVNLILQLVFLLPYLKHLDLRRNCFKQETIRTIEDKLRDMEGVTGVVRTQGQVLNIHSGNQLRLTVDLSEQMPKDQVAKEVDFSIQQELAHDDADPFLGSDAGRSEHPWTKTAINKQASPPQAVPDPSSVDLPQNTSGPTVPVPVMGGPPVGLGGPGNLSALTKSKDTKAAPAAKAGARADRVPGPPGRRNSNRRKAAPPAPLEEYVPSERVVDKWQAAPVMRPASRGLAHQRENSMRRSHANLTKSHPLSQASCGIDRSSSVPALHRRRR